MFEQAMTDREIIHLQKSGEYDKAFNAIVDLYSERLYRHVRRFLCSHEDTNDLLQDIFIKIWKALPSFKGESQIYTWIYRIATNEVLMPIRSLTATGSSANSTRRFNGCRRSNGLSSISDILTK